MVKKNKGDKKATSVAQLLVTERTEWSNSPTEQPLCMGKVRAGTQTHQLEGETLNRVPLQCSHPGDEALKH